MRRSLERAVIQLNWVSEQQKLESSSVSDVHKLHFYFCFCCSLSCRLRTRKSPSKCVLCYRLNLHMCCCFNCSISQLHLRGQATNNEARSQFFSHSLLSFYRSCIAFLNWIHVSLCRTTETCAYTIAHWHNTLSCLLAVLRFTSFLLSVA